MLEISSLNLTLFNVIYVAILATVVLNLLARLMLS